MTREQIIAAAKEAGAVQLMSPTKYEKLGLMGVEAIERLYVIAFEDGRVAEREECAKVCDEIAEADNGYWCAMTIRARGKAA